MLSSEIATLISGRYVQIEMLPLSFREYMESTGSMENRGIKYYVVDIGLRFMLLGSRQADVGHILENIVYLEILRRGYDVSVGKVDEYEVDFVTQSGRGTTYFQVALSVRNEQTLKRELRVLMSIRDHYPKFILTLDDDPEIQYDGIHRINARNWLLGLTD